MPRVAAARPYMIISAGPHRNVTAARTPFERHSDAIRTTPIVGTECADDPRRAANAVIRVTPACFPVMFTGPAALGGWVTPVTGVLPP
ncbi:hypothetical protein SY2F82_25720 [Streptomyces sp. Y2F8-2]|nr:hypothetical protein SY2F82_25720 [Streptomyces sp. Y2F8-2]